MKKQLPQLSLSNARCLLFGICLTCFVVAGSSGAATGTTSGNMSGYKEAVTPLQQNRIVKGSVKDAENNEGLPGVNVLIKGTNTGTVTDTNGEFVIEVASAESILVFTFIGYTSQEVVVGQQSVFDIKMKSDVSLLSEVVVVGYGEQKKETVIGAVTQTSAKVLTRTGGVSNLGAALTGNLPGLVTMASTGMPGDENPQILIRGRSTWNNNATPLILVDGVERPEFFKVMDVNSVESVSVLKDASATAVFGSRGANGVIIITTKRGREGKAEITATVNSTVKMVSKLPGKKDSYDAMQVRNRAIEYELSENPSAWSDIIPQQIVNKYRYPASAEEAERYPNVDWQNVLFKDYAMAYNASVGIRGGTENTKYYANLDFQNEGDLFREIKNDRGYEPGYAYNRLNFRNNLDFQLTPSTKLQTNLSGTYAVRKSPWGGGNDYNFWIAAYNNPPDVFVPRYADGFWGYYNPNNAVAQNSVRILSISGLEYTTTAGISTNFTVEQSLEKLLKGLNLKGSVALDNTFVESDRGVNDLYNDIQEMWVDPVTGQVFFRQAFESNSGFDFYDRGAAWSPSTGVIDGWASGRRLFYQLQANYAATINEDHKLTLMGLFNRQENATGSEVPRYREDWVFRTTYNFRTKYSFEYSGAYNGSEKFSPEYRFAFFSSGGLGWTISEENFMKDLSFIDLLKVRASYGQVGDDNVASGRWLFQDQWAYGESAKLGTVGWQSEYSPYTWYRQSSVGNQSVRWETVTKYNVGIDFGFLDGLFEGSIDIFKDDRKDILMAGSDRAVPSYYGTTAPVANLGRMQTKGFELVLKFNHTLDNGVRVWADFAMTHAKDKVFNRDDQQLLADYQKDAGYQLGQSKTHISAGYYNTWDELYASTVHNANDQTKIPGNYNIVDFNGDGVIDSFDAAPYGFSGSPQNTFNTNVGIEWKGLSFFVQFYGVNNVMRQVVFNSLTGGVNRVYDEGSYWSEENTNADSPMPRWKSVAASYNSGSRYFYDGSFLRVKNAELGYRFSSGWVNRVGLQSLRVYVSGNNLFLWTDMPDDRESNFAGTGWASQGAYPTVKRINLGLNLTF